MIFCFTTTRKTVQIYRTRIYNAFHCVPGSFSYTKILLEGPYLANESSPRMWELDRWFSQVLSGPLVTICAIYCNNS